MSITGEYGGGGLLLNIMLYFAEATIEYNAVFRGGYYSRVGLLLNIVLYFGEAIIRGGLLYNYKTKGASIQGNAVSEESQTSLMIADAEMIYTDGASEMVCTYFFM